MASRIQRSRAKGWRMPEGAIYVGRPTWAANPLTALHAIEMGYLRRDDPDFVIREFLTHCFREWLASTSNPDWWHGHQSAARRDVLLRRISELRGRDLACWCPLNHHCHADVLLELANRDA